MKDQEPLITPENLEKLDESIRAGFEKVANDLENALASVAVTNRIVREVANQERQVGLRECPDGTGPTTHPVEMLAGTAFSNATTASRDMDFECQMREAVHQDVTWFHYLMREALKVSAEEPDLDTALVKAAALIVSWIKDRDRRHKATEEGQK